MDGLTNPDVLKLAKCGSHGEYGGNVRRDLHRQFFTKIALPKPMVLDVPTKVTALKTADMPTSLLSPLDLCQFLHENEYKTFQDMFLTTPPRAFWGQIGPRDPKFVNLDKAGMRSDPGWMDNYIPIMMHGDGAVITKNEGKLLCVQWRSLLSRSFHKNIIPAFSMHSRARVYGDDATDYVCWRRLVHLFNAAFEGVHPLTDENRLPWQRGSCADLNKGTQFLGGRYKFVVWLLTHDLEYGANELGTLISIRISRVGLTSVPGPKVLHTL